MMYNYTPVWCPPKTHEIKLFLCIYIFCFIYFRTAAFEIKICILSFEFFLYYEDFFQNHIEEQYGKRQVCTMTLAVRSKDILHCMRKSVSYTERK